MERTFFWWCSVVKGGNVKGFKFVKRGRARVSWDSSLPQGAGLALAVKKAPTIIPQILSLFIKENSPNKPPAHTETRTLTLAKN